MNKEIMMLDAVERYIKGEMLPDEKLYFEELRRTNAEIDQMVVDHTFFLDQVSALGERNEFKASLNEVHNRMMDTGEIKIAAPKAKVIDLIKKYRKVVAVAASIAGIVALSISGLVSYFTPTNTNNSDYIQLKTELASQMSVIKKSQHAAFNEINELKNRESGRPAAEGKFGGTGFLIDPKGFLVTSAHVVKKADSVFVENSEGKFFKTAVVYVNDHTDVAILKIDDKRFQPYKGLPYTLRRSTVDLGEKIFTLGYPRNEIVYNEGYLSAKTGYNNDTVTYQLAISANAGNSGGPIFNNDGEVIGVLSGKQRTAEGVVFSSKSSNILKALDELHTEKKEDVKLSTSSSLKGKERTQQIKKIQDCVFVVTSY